MIVTFACMLGLAAIAKPLIILLIGEKWSENEQHTPFYEKTSDILLHKGKTDQGIQLINP